MSEVLPARPHLHWLKNCAKEKLQRLRAEKPAAKLAEAQLALAREYGFASWRKLKEQVDLIRAQGDIDVRDQPPPPSPEALSAELIKSFADAIHGDIERVRQMLDEHPALANATIEGHTMLHHAAGNGRAAAIRLLIQRGAAPNVYWAGCLHTPLSWAVVNNHPEACKALIEGGARLDLYCAAGMGRLGDVQSFFDEAGHVRPEASISASTRRRDDGTRIEELSSDPVVVVSDALYIACRNQWVEVAEYLLERGGDPNFRSYMEASCLHWAYLGGGEPKLIQALIAHGGDPNAIHKGRSCTPRAFGILVAAGWGYPHLVKRILDIDPNLVNIAEGGSTPLHEAAKGGNAEVVKILLDRGADRAQADAEGKTALDRASEKNHQAIVALLQA